MGSDDNYSADGEDTKTEILILERIRMLARTKKIISHMIGMIISSCSGILVVILQFCSNSRPANLLVNFNKLPTSE